MEVLIEIIPTETVFFDDYPLTKVFAEITIHNISENKIVFRV